MGGPPSGQRSEFFSIIFVINDTKLNSFAEFIIKVVISFFVFLQCSFLRLFSLFLQFLFSEGCHIFLSVFDIFFKLIFINVFPFGNFGDHIEDLFGYFLVNNFEGFCLLQSLSIDIERKVFGVNDTLDKAEIFWNHIAMLFSDQDSSNIELKIVLPGIVLTVEIIWSSVGNE